MNDPSSAPDRKISHNLLLFGCVGLLVVTFFFMAFMMLLVLGQDRERARFPGARAVSSHSNYTGLPYEYRWDDSYLVAEGNFTAVYNWYSLTFDLGAESRANGGCIQMDGETEQVSLRRTVNVLLCHTGRGQMVYITRTTAFNR